MISKCWNGDFTRSAKKYKGLFENFPDLCSTNPRVSLTEDIEHALKYSCGLKAFGDHATLKPDYDENGNPQNSILGKLIICLIPECDLQALKPFNVVAHHEAKHLKIKTHYANNILTEKEISFPGMIHEKYILDVVSFKVPSFSGPYSENYEEQFGLSKRSFAAFNRNNKNSLLQKLVHHYAKIEREYIKMLEKMQIKLGVVGLDGTWIAKD